MAQHAISQSGTARRSADHAFPTAVFRAAERAREGWGLDGHFPWCAPGACRTHQDDDGSSYIEHVGAQHDVVIGDGAARPLHLTALLSQDAEWDPEPTVHLYEDAGNCSILHAEDLPAAAEGLEGLALALRQMHTDLTRDDDAASIVAQLEASQAAAVAAGLNSPQLEAYHREVVQLVRESDDPRGVFAEIARLIARERGARPGPCTALDRQCTGEDCGDPHEPVHQGPERGLRVSFASAPLLPFHLSQWPGEQPKLAFSADGTWPALPLAQVDELLLAVDEYAGVLRATREHLAHAVAKAGDEK